MPLLLTPSWHLDGALFRLVLLRALQNDESVDSINAMIRADGLHIISSSRQGGFRHSIPQRGYVWIPSYQVIRTQEIDIILLCGVRTEQEGQYAWETYYNAGSFHAFASGSRTPDGLLAARDQIMSNPAMQFAASIVNIIGYSYGGAVGQHLMGPLGFPASQSQQRTCTTFGAPKACKTLVESGLQWSDTRHWFLSDDPVPLLPPSPTTTQRIMAGLTIGQGQNISGYWRADGGVEVTLSGAVLVRTDPSQVGLDPVTALRNWIAVTSQGIQNSHSIDTYISRVNAAGGRLPEAEQPYAPDTDTGGPGGGGNWEDSTERAPALPVAIATPGELRTAQTSVQTTFTALGRQQAAQPAEIPGELAFKAVRVGRTWYVQFLGSTILAAPHRRGARSFANTGNEMLRKLQTKATVDPGNFVTSLSNYLVAARAPAGGFRPVMEAGQLT